MWERTQLFSCLPEGSNEGAAPLIRVQSVEIAHEAVCGPAGLYVLEPGEGGQDIFLFRDHHCVPVIQPGVSRELGRVAVQAGIFEMQTQAGVDMESKIEYGCPLVDHHGCPVLAEDFDLGLIGVAGLDLVDGSLKEGAFVDSVSRPVAVILIFGPNEQAVEVVPFIRQQEICRILVCCAHVINDEKALTGKDQVKVFEKKVVGTDGRSLLLEIIGNGQEEVMEGKGFLAQKEAHVPDLVRSGSCLAEEADHGPVRVLKADDMPAVGPQFLCIVVAERIKDALQLIQGLSRRQAVFSMDPAAGCASWGVCSMRKHRSSS